MLTKVTREKAQNSSVENDEPPEKGAINRERTLKTVLSSVFSIVDFLLFRSSSSLSLSALIRAGCHANNDIDEEYSCFSTEIRSFCAPKPENLLFMIPHKKGKRTQSSPSPT